MLFHAALARALKDHGVTTMFGQIGDANLFMVDRFVNGEGGRYIGAAHEANAVMMSVGYAKRSGRLGVSTVTQGPGVTNTATALAEGVKSRVPTVLIAGDTPLVWRDNNQDIDQQALTNSVGAGFEQVRSQDHALEDLASAIRRAQYERRPIVLNVPAEYMWNEIDYQRYSGEMLPRAIHPDPDALDRAVGVMASVRRPLVLVGRGVDAGALRSVLRLAERIGAPIATTLAAKGGVVGERFALGISGTFSTEVGIETIQSADCIIAFGASLNLFTTAFGSFSEGKAVIHVDADPTAIGRFTAPTVAVVGDAGATAEAMFEIIESGELPASNFRSPELAARLADEPPGGVALAGSSETTVDVGIAMRRLNLAVPKHRTIVTDGGRFMSQPLQHLDVPDPSALIYTVGFGAVGMGVGAAIGAAVAAPDDPVVLVTGDGGFMSSGIGEFNTAVREQLDLIVVVCNDGAYGAEHVHFRDMEMDPALSTFDWPDFAPVADALGGRGMTVRCIEDLDVAERAIAARDRPLLIDLKLDPDNIPRLL